MLDLSKYETTVEGEKSLYKGIPIVYRYHPLVRKLMKSRLFSVKYRGCSKKGYSRPQDGCHKEYADYFSIYPYSTYDEYWELRKYVCGTFEELHALLEKTAKEIVNDGL